MPVLEPERRQAPRPAWWKPGMRHAAKRDVAGAIYGLILATSVIAVSRQYTQNAGVTAVTVIVTAAVFWLAHVYAGSLAIGLEVRRRPTWAEVRRVIDEEWPLVQSGVLPTVVLLLGPLGVLADGNAQDAALVACLVELAATGLMVARATGASGLVAAISGAISLSFGVVLVVLKVVVH
jgi:hypothetical protein